MASWQLVEIHATTPPRPGLAKQTLLKRCVVLFVLESGLMGAGFGR